MQAIKPLLPGASGTASPFHTGSTSQINAWNSDTQLFL